MSVKIRMMRMGKKKSPFYRIVVMDSRKSRDGQYVEQIGTYAPMARQGEEAVKIDNALAKQWLGRGAQPSLTVRQLFSGQSIVEKPQKGEVKKKHKRKGRNHPIKEMIERRRVIKAKQEAARKASEKKKAAKKETEAAAEATPVKEEKKQGPSEAGSSPEAKVESPETEKEKNGTEASSHVDINKEK